MLHYLSIFFIFFKLFCMHFETYILSGSLKENFVLLIMVLLAIYLIKQLKKITLKEDIIFRIMKYRFDYDLERYYSIFVAGISLMSYIILLMYLRILSVDKTIKLLELKKNLMLIIYQNPFIVLFLMFILMISAFYLIFILILGNLRIYIYKEIVKLHFYYYDNKYYHDILEALKITYSISGLYGFFSSLYYTICDYLALGYRINIKNKPFRMPTKEENKKTSEFWLHKYINIYYLLPLLYNLHLILFICFLCYDIIFNDYQIQYTLKVLPYLFVYQIYVIISKFSVEKATTDICFYTNVYFYHEVLLLNANTMVIDGELSEIPFNFAEEFLKYEESGFTQGYGTSKIY